MKQIACRDCAENGVEGSIATHVIVPSGTACCRDHYIKRIGGAMLKTPNSQKVTTPEIVAAIKEYTDAVIAATPDPEAPRRVEVCCSECRKKLDNRGFRSLISSELSESEQQRLDDLLNEIAKSHNLKLEELLAKSRDAKRVQARREFSVLAHESGFSFPQIGRRLGMHHTSIVHLVQTA